MIQFPLISKCVVVGYLYSIILGGIFTSWAMYLLHTNEEIAQYIKSSHWPAKRPKTEANFHGYIGYSWQVGILGTVERVLYLTSILVGRPEFIAVWLTLKTVYRSWTTGKMDRRGEFNNFIIGNGLSIIYAFSGAALALGDKRVLNHHQEIFQFLSRVLYNYFAFISPIALSGLIIGISYFIIWYLPNEDPDGKNLFPKSEKDN